MEQIKIFNSDEFGSVRTIIIDENLGLPERM